MKHQKKRVKLHGEEAYYLGLNKENERVYLNAPSWDCGHYWGFGYISTYTGEKNTQNNFSMHTHFKGYIIGEQEEYTLKGWVKNGYTHHLNEVLKETVLNDTESWVLSELLQTAYKFREISEVVNKGGANVTNNPLRKFLIDDDYYKRINKVILRELFIKIDELLRGENDKPLQFKLNDNKIKAENGGRY